jgi:hypothetical protein
MLKMAQETIQLRTYVTPEVRKKLKIIAAQEELTIADLLRKAVEEYLKTRGIEIDMSEGLDTWGGSGRKNKSDDES